MADVTEIADMFEWLDEHVRAKNWSYLNGVLNTMADYVDDEDLITGALRYTYKVKENIKDWTQCRNRMYDKLQARFGTRETEAIFLQI